MNVNIVLGLSANYCAGSGITKMCEYDVAHRKAAQRKFKILAPGAITVVILLLLVILPVQVRSATEDIVIADPDPEITLGEQATLADYLKFAKTHNPGLEAARQRSLALEARAPQVGSLPDPKFGFSQFLDPVETRVGPQRRKYSLTQAFPWFGTLGAKRHQAEYMAKAAYQDFISAQDMLAERVSHVYFDLFFSNQARQITNNHLELLMALEQVAQRRYATGSMPQTALLQIQLEQARLADSLLTIQARVTSLTSRMNAALNRPETERVYLNTLPYSDSLAMNKSELVQTMFENNPKLAGRNRRLDSFRAAESAARRLAFPTFSFGIDYIQTDESPMPGVLDSGKDALALRLGASLPIWRGKTSARIREAKAGQLQAKHEIDEYENRLMAQLDEVLFFVNVSYRKTRFYLTTQIPLAEQALRLEQTGFETGRVSFRDFIEAERELLNSELSYQRSLVAYNKALATLRALTGDEHAPQGM